MLYGRDHCTRVFCSISHMSGALKEFKLLHAAPFINVSSKTVDQSEDHGALRAYSSRLAWQLLYLTATWRSRHSVLRLKKKSKLLCSTFHTALFKMIFIYKRYKLFSTFHMTIFKMYFFCKRCCLFSTFDMVILNYFVCKKWKIGNV